MRHLGFVNIFVEGSSSGTIAPNSKTALASQHEHQYSASQDAEQSSKVINGRHEAHRMRDYMDVCGALLCIYAGAVAVEGDITAEIVFGGRQVL